MAHQIDRDRPLTLEAYQALPHDDFYRDEVSRGYLVREPPPGSAHGRLVVSMIYQLRQYLEQAPKRGQLYTEAGFLLAEEPLTVRAPDVAYVRAERAQRGYVPEFFRGPPDLAIEVLSPNDRAGEVLHKVSEYLEAGTALAWVVDPANEIVVVHDQSGTPRVLRAPERVEAVELLPGFSLDIAKLFAEY